ncbi:MAG: PAS domain S-box protein [Pseudomonadota bacterium]
MPVRRLLLSTSAWRYALPFALTALALLPNFYLAPLLAPNTLLSPFLIGVLLSALFGGWGPGLLATALSILALNHYFLPAPQTFGTEALLRSTSFIVMSGLISGLSHWLRQVLQESEAERAEQAFLARTGALLAESLDFDTALRKLARLAVSYFSDWCLITMVEPDRANPRLFLAGRDPDRENFLPQLEEAYRIDARGRYGSGQAIASGRPVLIERFTDAHLAAMAPDPAQFALFQRMAVTSYLSVPLIARDRVIGSIAFGRSGTRRHFEARDLALAEELARRGALAVDNALLYREARLAEASLRESQASQQASEELLRISEERYRSLVQATSQAVWLANGGGEVIADNAFWRELTGQAEGQMLGWGWEEAVHPRDRDRVVREWLESVIAKSAFQSELRVHGPAGDRHVAVRAVPVCDRYGSVREYVGTLSDITERKQAEEALQASEARFRATFNQAAVGMALATASGELLQVNQRLCEITGYACGELLQRTFRDITHPDDLETELALRRRLLTGEIPVYDLEKRYIRRNGQLFWVNATVSLVRTETGAPAYTIAVIQDITERRRAEAAVQRLNAELERRVAERTAELEAFSYSVSHDLRAPLRAIDGFSLVLLEDYGEALDAAGREHLTRVRRASQRMSGIIDAMLNLARLSRDALRREPLDLSARARDIAERLCQSEPARPVAFDIAGGLTATGDPRLLGAVLENLLGNAWKFTRKQADARIEFGAFAQDGQTVYFVRDNGAGFDMAYADKLFGAFQRLHSPGEFEGHGIGLATVARIIARHGGRIWAEGAVGRGATFYFTLGGTGS